MFYFLQKHRWLQLIIIVVAMIFFCRRLFTAPLSFTHYDAFLPCAVWLSAAVAQSQTLFRIVVLAVVVLECFLLVNFFKKSRFLEQKTFFPVIWFLLFMVSGGHFAPIMPVFFTNFIVLCLVNLNRDYQNVRIKMQVFLSGILIGLASFIDFTAVLLLLYVMIALVINRISKLKDMIVTLFGFLLPYIYMFAYHFFVGDVAAYAASFGRFAMQFPLRDILSVSPWKLSAIAVFILLFPYLLISLKMQFDSKLIIIRQRYVTLNLLVFTLFLMVIFSNIPFPYTMACFFVPLSFYFTAMIPEKRISIAKEIVLVLLASAVVLVGLPQVA